MLKKKKKNIRTVYEIDAKCYILKKFVIKLIHDFKK